MSGPVGEYFLFALTAQATTLPILLYLFQGSSLSSLLANPVILPAPETLEAVAGRPLLQTDQNRWIELSTDGQQIWVEVERK
jgi:hypothetical protein